MVANFVSLGKNVEALESVFREANDTFVPTLLERIDEKSDSLTLTDYINKLVEKGNVFVYMVDEHIAGVVGVYTNDITNSLAYIPILFVLERFKRMKIASILLRFTIEFAISLNMHSISIKTTPHNLPALNLYSKFSFVRTQSSVESVTLIKYLK